MDFMNAFTLTSIVTLVIILIRTFVDHFEDTDLERKLTTNFKKLKVNITFDFVLSSIMTIIFIGYLIYKLDANVKKKLVSNLNELQFDELYPIIKFVIIIFFLFFILCFVFRLFVSFIVLLISIKPKYYIELFDKGFKEKWIIIKRSGKGLLVKKMDDVNKYMIIDNWNNQVIVNYNDMNIWEKKIYSTKIFPYILLIFSIVAVCVFLWTFFYVTNVLNKTIGIMLIVILIISILILVINKLKIRN